MLLSKTASRWLILTESGGRGEVGGGTVDRLVLTDGLE